MISLIVSYFVEPHTCHLWKGWKISIGRCCNWTV